MAECKDPSCNCHRTCADCGKYHADNYIVKDEVWAQAGMAYTGHLHLACLAKRLGRDVRLDDFGNEPINSAVVYLLEIIAELVEAERG